MLSPLIDMFTGLRSLPRRDEVLVELKMRSGCDYLVWPWLTDQSHIGESHLSKTKTRWGEVGVSYRYKSHFKHHTCLNF